MPYTIPLYINRLYKLSLCLGYKVQLYGTIPCLFPEGIKSAPRIMGLCVIL